MPQEPGGRRPQASAPTSHFRENTVFAKQIQKWPPMRKHFFAKRTHTSGRAALRRAREKRFFAKRIQADS